MTFETLWTEYDDIRNDLNTRSPKQGPVSDDLVDIAKLRQSFEISNDRVLGHPDSFDKVRCWMVDARGTHSERMPSQELVGDMVEDATKDTDSFGTYVDSFGALPSEVRSVMRKWNLTDSGCGWDSWHLGCHCTEQEARQLCGELYRRFGHAINVGILKIERKPWSLRLKV